SRSAHQYPAVMTAWLTTKNAARFAFITRGDHPCAAIQTHFRQFAPHGSVVIAAESRISPSRW
ncbi:MAG: hypothetical protein AB1651_19850, partial [Pseudomonadota bacterium]